ncbi:MAG: hypothetical protein R3F49_15880 [Planctomycetota bacterium]
MRESTTGFLDQAAGVLAASTILTYAIDAVDNATNAVVCGVALAFVLFHGRL